MCEGEDTRPLRFLVAAHTRSYMYMCVRGQVPTHAHLDTQHVFTHVRTRRYIDTRTLIYTSVPTRTHTRTLWSRRSQFYSRVSPLYGQMNRPFYDLCPRVVVLFSVPSIPWEVPARTMNWGGPGRRSIAPTNHGTSLRLRVDVFRRTHGVPRDGRRTPSTSETYQRVPRLHNDSCLTGRSGRVTTPPGPPQPTPSKRHTGIVPDLTLVWGV